MTASRPVDVVAIASRVWEALEGHDREADRPADRDHREGESGGRAASLAELAALVDRLAGELEHIQRVQQDFEQQIQTLMRHLHPRIS